MKKGPWREATDAKTGLTYYCEWLLLVTNHACKYTLLVSPPPCPARWHHEQMVVTIT
jgi:hypothetical protein